jgi:SpoVK/Ycf46/Vps4 family AAA+-type ATPase
VLILTTSNVTSAIDLAFVDRADIKKFIGLPTARALYKIYYSCLKELMRVRQNYQQDLNLALILSVHA